MNLRLLRKVERLESWVRPRAGPEPRDQVVSAALRRLATDDLLLLIGTVEGPDPGKALSAELLVSAGVLTVVAGYEGLGSSGVTGPAASAQLTYPKRRCRLRRQPLHRRQW